ncbi:hypothetical protein NLI96_g4817 [Meripilus lineatus]|uniref:DUF6589 domain-containing protein n=1 Tax=Meripilus lineatus TaxID=2056292 RepID=A0AAD5YJQ6_9APHY|nr:hypothetical protein NLI96_g4817 [Physisporinus lineatus]
MFHEFSVEKSPQASGSHSSGTPVRTYKGRTSSPEKLKQIFDLLQKLDLTLGDFLKYSLERKDKRGNPIEISTNHQAMISQFLSGKGNVNPVDVVDLIYNHSHSRPKPSVAEELASRYARPQITDWALECVMNQLTKEADKLVQDPALRVRATRKDAVQEMLQSTPIPPSVPVVEGAEKELNPIDSATVGEIADRILLDDLGAVGERIVREIHALENGEDLENMEGELEESDDEDDEDAGGMEEAQRMESDLGNRDASVNATSESERRTRQRGKSADTHVSWDIIEKFSVASLMEKYQNDAPTIWKVLTSLTGNAKARNSKSGGSYRPKPIVCTSILSEIFFARNQYCNLFALCRSIAMFAMKSHQSAFRTGSRMAQCVPYSTTRNALVAMAQYKSQWLKENPLDEIRSVVLDNVQQYARRRDHRIGTANELMTGTGATAIVMENCPPDAFEAKPYLEKLDKCDREKLSVASLQESIDWTHLQLVSELHFLDIVVQYVPSLASYRKDVSKLFKDCLKKNPIDPTRRTRIHPLGTNDANEVSLKGMNEALSDILDQLGIDDEVMRTKLQFVSGDGKSFQVIGDMKKLLEDQPTPDQSLITLVEILELWHTKWTELSRNFVNKFGSINAQDDPSTIRFVANVINSPIPSNLGKVDFYPNARLLDVTVRAHMLRFWEVQLGTEDIVTYFHDLARKNRLPTLGHLREIARELSAKYSTTDAYENALRVQDELDEDIKMNVDDGPDDEDNHSIGSAEESDQSESDDESDTESDKEHGGSDNTSEQFKGDWPLANSILLIRDGIWFLEYCRAVASGDTGRVWEILKVWIFTFAGGRNTNYTNYLLEMYCKIVYEFTDSTKKALFENWLVNLSGKIDGFIELDLMQEHFNLWLEELAQYKGKEFSDPWYRLVLSMHVHHFLRLKEEMEKMVELVPRRKGHTEPHLDNEFSEILRIFRERNIHRFHEGRDFGHHSKDHFTIGTTKLGEGKIKKFIERTLQRRKRLMTRYNIDEAASDPTTNLQQTHALVV